MVGPWIHALFGRRKRLSDIEFLAIKEFDGKLVENEGFLSAAGDLATLTASAGKDMYLAEAKLSVSIDAASVLEQSIISLVVNGIVRETYESTMQSLGTSSDNYEFAVKGVKVSSGQIIKLEADFVDATTLQIEAVMVLFEENEGASPIR